MILLRKTLNLFMYDLKTLLALLHTFLCRVMLLLGCEDQTICWRYYWLNFEMSILTCSLTAWKWLRKWLTECLIDRYVSDLPLWRSCRAGYGAHSLAMELVGYGARWLWSALAMGLTGYGARWLAGHGAR